MVPGNLSASSRIFNRYTALREEEPTFSLGIAPADGSILNDGLPAMPTYGWSVPSFKPERIEPLIVDVLYVLPEKYAGEPTGVVIACAISFNDTEARELCSNVEPAICAGTAGVGSVAEFR